MSHKLAKIHYILVEFGLLGMNSFFGKSSQISGIFQVSVTLNPKSMSMLSSSGKLKPFIWKVEPEGGKGNCFFVAESCHPGHGGNTESICSKLDRESKRWGH